MILFETEGRSDSELFKRLSRRPVRIMMPALLALCLITFLPIATFLPYPTMLTILFGMTIAACLFQIIKHAFVPKRYIYQVILDGDRLDFYYSFRGQEKILTLYRDNFVVTYYIGTDYTSFVFEQQRPYKKLFTQYGFGAWSEPEAVSFLEPYGKVRLPKGRG